MEINEMQEKFLLRNGVDEVVYPEKQLASWTAIRCVSDHVLDYIELDDDYSIYELAIPSEWCGKTILQLDIRKKYNTSGGLLCPIGFSYIYYQND